MPGDIALTGIVSVPAKAFPKQMKEKQKIRYIFMAKVMLGLSG